ncbi:MAG: hypothetical protein IT323_19560 [Anaerolineae bacterium]|nr:hypothetical protein [Anaerolineae bacterium]
MRSFFSLPAARWMRLSGLLVCLGLALAACTSPGSAPGADQSLAGLRVLAWNPDTRTVDWYAAAGQPTTVDSVQMPRAVAIACAASPDGAWMVMHLGRDAVAPQAIYPLGDGQLVPLGENHGLACTLPDGVQFSPDMRALGVLRYADAVLNANFAAGVVQLYRLPDGAPGHTASDVVAYRLYDNGLLTLHFYPNDRAEATTADLRWWDGSAERIVATDITPGNNCVFITGKALRQGDDVIVLLGEACRGQGSRWRLLRGPFAGGSTLDEAASGQTGGAYFTYAATAGLWPMPSGDDVLIAYPNGLNLDVANLARVRLRDGETTPVLVGMVAAMHPPARTRQMVFDRANTRLAAVTRDGNGSETLYTYDLEHPEREAARLAGGERSDRISGLAWTDDGARLYYLINGNTNALYVQALASQSERRLILRGNYQGLAITPDGSVAAVSRQERDGGSVRNHLLAIPTGDAPREIMLVEGLPGESALAPLAVRLVATAAP